MTLAVSSANTDTQRDASDALPVGTRLAEFEVRGVLGLGGFGIVYLAWDLALEREVALKEYMPVALAGRGRGPEVSLRSQAQRETFAIGLRSFVNEARLLARFDHASLVKVYRFWEDNGTAYMVMPYYRGRTLRQQRQAMGASPDEAACRRLIDPMLSALELLHAEGVYHRDIAPDNILIGEDGAPVLLDFGAARQVINRTQSLTAILKPNFAPLEQYADMASMRQGPWTDFYGLGATVYYFITGQAPLPAAARALNDELPPLAARCLPGCSPVFLEAIDWTLALRPQERPQSAAVLRAVLEGRMAAPCPAPRTAEAAEMRAMPAQGWRSQRVAASMPPPSDVAFDPTQPAPRERLPALVVPAAPARRRSWRVAASLAGAAAAMGLGWWALAPAPAVSEQVVRTEPRRAGPVRVAASPASVPAATATQAVSHASPPAARPRPARATMADGPRERCGDRRFLVLLVCMKQQCEQPALRGHPECKRMEEMEQAQRQP
jgi:serine/threonine protein kinase